MHGPLTTVSLFAHRAATFALGAGFLAFLAIPHGARWLGIAPTPELAARIEKRRLAPWPTWPPRNMTEWRAWPRAIETALDDRLAWRAAWISAHSRLLLALGISSRREVLIGSDGTLFYDLLRLRGCGRAPGYGATSALPRHHLDLVARVLAERHAWLAARNIRYLVVLIPDKQNVYPERLPAAERALVQPGSVATQVADHLRNSTDVRVLDLTPALRAAKPLGELYYRYDTHWTPLGATVGAAAILQALRREWPDIPPFPPADAWERARPESPPHLDLARLLGVEAWFAEAAPSIRPRGWPEPTVVLADGELRTTYEYAGPRPDLPSAWILHDSFTGLLGRFLAPAFSRSRFQWHTRVPFSPAEIEVWRPDLVMEILVERHAVTWTANPPAVSLEKERHAFAASDRTLEPTGGVGGWLDAAPEDLDAAGHRTVTSPSGRAELRLAGVRFEGDHDIVLRLRFQLPSPARLVIDWNAGRGRRRLGGDWPAGASEWYVRLRPPQDDGPFRLTVEGPDRFVVERPEWRCVPSSMQPSSGIGEEATGGVP